MSMGQQTRVSKICPEHGQHHGGGEVEQKSVKNVTRACAYSTLLEQVLFGGGGHFSRVSGSRFFSLWTQSWTSNFAGASRALASDWGCLAGPSYSEASSFLDSTATTSPGSPACRQPLWDYSASGHISQSNISLLIILYILLVMFFQRTVIHSLLSNACENLAFSQD